MSVIQFRHPGTMLSPEMTFSLQQDCLTDPIRKRALDTMIKDTPFDYKPKALPIVDIGFNGVGSGHQECTKDGEMAYRAALLYWATRNDQYANLVVNILSAWSITNKVWKGDNAPLEAAWSVCSFARAAELIRDFKGFSKIKEVFYKWIDTLIIPVLKNKNVWKWKLKGNWHYSILSALMQIAILRDDSREFNEALQKYKEILPLSICVNHPCHIAETTRDITHASFLLGGILQVPEMAYHQGVKDLYDNRLHPIMEYHARIMLKEVPEGITKEDIHTPYGYWIEPVWEIGYSHFNGRLGLSMPKTETLLTKCRPERVTFHWGGGTLTHYKRSSK